MKSYKKIVSLFLVLAMVLGGATAFAAPQTVIYKNADNAVVEADYAKAVNLATEEDNKTMLEALKTALGDVIQFARDLVVVEDDGKVINYKKALDDTVGYTDASGDEQYYLATKPEATKELNEAGEVVDRKEGEEVDLTAYNEALAAVVEADYTAESWVAYQEIVAANIVTEENTQEEVDAATEAIVAAQANLVKIGAEDELVVESVSAINLRQIAVTFNEEVASNTVNATNLRVYDAANNNQIAGVTVKLAADNKTAYLLNTYTQLKNYKVVVENVASKADATKKVAKTENTVQAMDTTLPTAEGIAVKSPKTLELTFSEPIKDFPTVAGVTDKVKIDGINAYFATIDQTKMDTENTVTVTLGTALTVGDHKVKIAGLNDYANLPVAEKEFTVTVVADTTAPAVESASATSKDKVTVKFNKPVDGATVTAGTGTDGTIKVFEGTTAKAISTAAGGIATKDNQTFELTLTANLGLASLVDASIKVKGVKDAYGNEIKEEQVFKFTATDDQVAPTVSDVKVNTDNTLEVTFSEDVTNFAGNANALELYDKDNKKVVTSLAIASKTIDSKPSLKVYNVSITGGATLAGNYTLKFVKEQVKDNSIRENFLVEATKAIAFNDKVAPKVLSAVFVNETAGADFNSDGDVLDSKITIYFDKAMDAATLTSSANYLLGGSPLADVKGASLAAAADNKAVTITINRAAPDTQFAFATTTDLRVIAVKDAAGNTLDSSFVNADLGTGGKSLISGFVSNAAFNTIIDVTKVEVIAKNQIKVYAVAGTLIESIDPNKVKFDKGGAAYAALQVTGVTLATDKKSAVLTLNNNLGADASVDGGVLTVYADADAVATSTGVKSALVATGSGVAVVDKVKPTVQPVDGKFLVTGDTVTVKFDEALDATVTTAANALVVKDSKGNQLVPTSDYTVAYANSNKDLALKIVKAGFNDKVSVSLANNVTLKDVIGNFANDFAATESKDSIYIPVVTGITGSNAQTAAGVAPTPLVPAVAGVDTITFDTTAGNFNAAETVTIDGQALTLATGGTAAVTATEVKGLAEANATLNAKYTITDNSAGVLTFTEKAGQETAAVLTAVTSASQGTVTAASITVGAPEVPATPGTAEVNTLTISGPATAAGNITVTFNDGGADVVKTVAVANGETAAQVAAKIATAFAGTTGWTVTNTPGSADVVFTAAAPAADKTVTITVVNS
jgi:hypothetical protein